MTDVDERFNRLMDVLDQPMIVVTTASAGARAGCLVGFHAQIGIEPPTYAVWLSKANHTYRIGALAETFAVHVLGRDDRGLAELFGQRTGDEVDKFESCRWTEGPDGVPLLDDCANRFVATRTAWLDPGTDHVCVALRPIAVDVEERPGEVGVLPFSSVRDLDPGHGAEERQRPIPADEPAGS